MAYNEGNPNNDILLIGNGFDIHHGYKTRYSDFIYFLLHLDHYNKSDIIDYFEKLANDNSFIKCFI